MLAAAVVTALAVGTASVSTSSIADATVVSGGVSLGSYQAGYLYLAAHARKRAGRAPAKLYTGASAGSANALIAGIEGCRPLEADPTESLGWKVWIPVGFDQLFVPEETSPVGVFTSREMKKGFDKMADALESGLPRSCDFVLGVTATRLEPLPVDLTDGLSVPRQEEKFAVRIRGQGEGTPASLTNFVDPYRDVPQPLIPLDGVEPREAFERLSLVLFASGSFPLAFSPTPVPHCLTEPPGNEDFIPAMEARCEAPTRTDLFVDGGIFDNGPLRFAFDLARRGLRTESSGKMVWRDLTRSARLDRRRSVVARFHYVDPWTRAYPAGDRTEAEAEQGTDTLMYGARLLGRLVASARGKELYNLAERRDELSGKLELSRIHFPAAGDLFFAFFGFFERDLRVFDFYLGMYDAHVANRRDGLDTEAQPWGRGSPPKSWAPFACMLGWFEPGQEDLRSSCEGEDLSNFRKLLQLSMDRLHAHCARLKPEQLRGLPVHARCEAAAAGSEPPRLITDAPPLPERMDRANDVLQRLSDLQFAFHDMGLDESESDQIAMRLRRRFVAIANRLDEVQEHGRPHVIGLAGRYASNGLRYESPEWMVPLLLGSGSLETGLIISPFDHARHLIRLSATAQLRNWSSLFLPGPTDAGLAAGLGVELLIPPLTTAIAQPSLGARVGYQWGGFDDMGTDECRATPSLADSRSCSQWLVQPFLALGILDVVRLQLNLDIFPEAGWSEGLASRHYRLDMLVGLTMF